MNGFLLFVILAYSIFPIWILLMIPRSVEKKIRISRFKHAIPAFFLTLINISALIYYWKEQQIPFMKEGTYMFLIPPLLLLLVVIVWNAGRRQERIIQMDLARSEIEKVRFQKEFGSRQVIITSFDDTEKL